MKQPHISPFYFPTTVFFIDDNAGFLNNLSLQLNDRLAFLLCDNPVTALTTINTISTTSRNIDKYFAFYRSMDYFPLNDHLVAMNPDKIHREVHNEQRFQQISVVVVDFDMPSMNGLDFCRNIQDPAIKKILLTGKADEKIAVEAFNLGIIDSFIPKQDPAVIQHLNEAIDSLQQTFFRDSEAMLSHLLSIGFYRFLRDPVFIARFQELCEQYQIVEYYLCSKPEGVLMLTADATPLLLLVQTEDDLLSHYQIAYDQAAPEELLDALKSYQLIPYFWHTQGVYKPECENWQRYLFPATPLQGECWYYYSLIKHPLGIQLDGVLSYNDYIEQLDKLGRNSIGSKFFQLRDAAHHHLFPSIDQTRP